MYADDPQCDWDEMVRMHGKYATEKAGIPVFAVVLIGLLVIICLVFGGASVFFFRKRRNLARLSVPTPGAARDETMLSTPLAFDIRPPSFGKGGDGDKAVDVSDTPSKLTRAEGVTTPASGMEGVAGEAGGLTPTAPRETDAVAVAPTPAAVAVVGGFDMRPIDLAAPPVTNTLVD